MTSLSKVFLRTDKAMRNDFDCLSATITLLTFSGVLCAWGELLLKILYVKFSDEFLFIAYFFSLLYFQDLFDLGYFSGFLGFPWWGFGVGVRVTVVALESGAVS